MMNNVETLCIIMYLAFTAAGFISHIENRQWIKKLKNFGTFCLVATPFFGMMFYFITN